ncbi:MAG: hypothetical protein ABIR53_02115 [Paraperlucidibaca sp.]
MKATLLSAMLACPSFASAHSFGQLYNLPVPLWMYLYGAAAALLASFVLVAVFIGAAAVDTSAPHPALQRPPSLFARCCQALLPVLRRLSVGLLLLCIATGFFGTQNPYMNFNMTFFWIMFILLFTYLTAFVGDVFRFVSPWRVITDALPAAWRNGRYHYPERLAYWPALLFYVGFISLELFAKTTPQGLASLLLGYSMVNLLGVSLLGQRAWFRYIEFFSVFLRLVAMMAPLQWRQGRLLWRMPFSGLNGHRAESYSLVVFILFMLASTAFDGLRGTITWVNVFWADTFNILTPWLGKPPVYFYVQLRPWYTVYELTWLWLSPLIYFTVFMVFVALARGITGTAVSTRELALRLAFSLLPIALVYHLTHYYTLIFTQGVKIVSLLSDPFGWGWNLFATVDVFRRPIMPDMAWIWHSQVGLIVFGHIVSVYVAHREATALLASSRQAAVSQLPMLALMMLLTASGLWILAQPMSGGG